MAYKKPSEMKRTGKAQMSPRSKAAYAANKLGGQSGKARDVIQKRKAQTGAIMNMTTHSKKGK